MVSAIFELYFKRKPLKNNQKGFLFHVKSSYRFRDIKVFVFLLFLLQPLLVQNGNCIIITSSIDLHKLANAFL